jgi:hypothetical protein
MAYITQKRCRSAETNLLGECLPARQQHTTGPVLMSMLQCSSELSDARGWQTRLALGAMLHAVQSSA